MPVFILMIASMSIIGQQSSILGSVINENGEGIGFATVILKSAKDSVMVKADITDESGGYVFERLEKGNYFIESNLLGMIDYRSDAIALKETTSNHPPIVLKENAKLIEEVVVTAARAIIEVKSDRTIFNVQGTINSAGDNGLNLLRKAPGVLVDNNNNISVLGRSGVLIYVDGKRIPLRGDDLTIYLQNMTSEQIDKIDIITNPGSKYEAQGNAGIIDIRLKKDKNLGGNGSISGSYGHGRYGQGNLTANGNYRNKSFNTFGSLGYNKGIQWNKMVFLNYQNGLLLDATNLSTSDYHTINGRLGTDFYLSKKSTIGFLVSAQENKSEGKNDNFNYISAQSRPGIIDSVLIALNTSTSTRKQTTYNINYAYESGKNRLNIDLDFGKYRNIANNSQPNLYYNPAQTEVISKNINSYTTPVNIDIATAKLDYETELLGGSLGFGSKISNVITDNTFLFYNIINDEAIINNKRSNQFKYEEMVYAGYVNYARSLSAKWNMTAGLRVEKTDAKGDLTAFLPELEEEPVVFDYYSYFPSAGLTYQQSPEHLYSINYGRRINRPDYNILNPFREQISELSYSRGNKFLQPEIVNNLEIGYTLKYRYSFKLAYSLTSNQITRLIGPDDIDPRARFISWDNLATQKLYSFNVSAPFDVTKWWNAYMNLGVSYVNNQADYGNGAVVDVQAGSYNIYQQHTFTLPNKFKGEISGWYSGPGVWGGVFLYDDSYSLNLGLQRKFLQDKMNVRLSVGDITYQTGWSGYSVFNGLRSEGRGNWDSRRATISISYDFGNSNVKSRKRSTGIENESKRVGS
ncbi:MAG: TonB-dependent receptor [Saprospiraceae bacterium]|nr:TonB-dependent receptor [Saprospiraceae bacterium]